MSCALSLLLNRLMMYSTRCGCRLVSISSMSSVLPLRIMSIMLSIIWKSVFVPSDSSVSKSNKSFEEKDFEAWYVAYDMVKLLNNEMSKSNDLLRKCGTSQFQAKSVRGVESQEELSLYIKTKGWKPCDAEIHIGDVEHLIME